MNLRTLTALTRCTALAGAFTLAAAAHAIDYPEIEPNDTKAQALANGPFVLASGDSVSGITTTATTTGLDYFLIKTPPMPPGIYKHRLTLTSATPGHVVTIRGLNQVAAAPAVWPGNVGTAGGTDTAAQTGAGGVVQWYGFGREEQIYYRVSGTAATTEPYTATMDTEQVFSVLDCGVWQPGAITISTVPPGHGNDVDLMVYDSDFNPIPGYANDGASTNGGHSANTNNAMFLRRHYDPGEYYILSSNFDLINNLGSPCDDNRRTGQILDFADGVVESSALAPSHLHFTMTDALGSTQFADGLVVTQFNSTKANAFEVRWHRFTVGGPTTGACCLPDGSCAVTTPERCELILNGAFQAVGTSCGSCPELPAGEWINRAPAPYSRVGAAGAIVGSTFYLLGGSNASALRSPECWKYDLVNNQWFSIASMPHSGSAAPQLGGVSNIDAAAIGTDIYVVGGFIGPAATVPPLTRVLRYDTVLDAWEEITSDPYPTTIYGSGVVAHGGKLYVISGATLASPFTMTDACYVYDPAAPAGSRWSPIAPIPVARLASATVVGNQIYAIASGDAAVDADRVDVYDIASGMWSQAPSLGALRGGCAAYELGGLPYASAGGLTTFLATGEVLDGGVWTTGPSVINGMRSMAFDGNSNWLVRSTGFSGAYRAFTEILRQEPGGDPTGACCLSGSCFVDLEANCVAFGGTYQGNGTGCFPDPCAAPATGACCNGTSCSVATAGDCAAGGGTYEGDGTVCGDPGNPTTCCRANFDGINGVGVPDIFAFLGAWFSGNPSADIDGVGGIAVPDIFAFLSLWFAGCS